MRVVHRPTKSVGRMVRSSKAEVEIQLFNRDRYGHWTATDQTATVPRHECQFYLSDEAAVKAVEA
jgi:hypothetical protein